jgi:hypothetical protein
MCAKSLKMTNAVTVVSKLVNFVRSNGMNHRQFKYFYRDLEYEYGDALFYMEVNWLGCGRMIKTHVMT